MNRLRKGDTVCVTGGADKGKTGKVLRLEGDGDRVVVEGVNLLWRHMKKSQQNPQGGRVKRESPVSSSNVMLVDPESGEPTRIAYRVVDGKKVRVAKKSGKPIPAPARE
ncbi:MAG: 50S ribosomal protein L24 [Planctomycetota bacterium]|jgi:large subunit ribosomal protein L24